MHKLQGWLGSKLKGLGGDKHASLLGGMQVLTTKKSFDGLAAAAASASSLPKAFAPNEPSLLLLLLLLIRSLVASRIKS